MSNHYHYEGEEYCENCLPVDPASKKVDLDYGEQDYPANCCKCRMPLDCTLTADGVDYVLTSIKVALETCRDRLKKPQSCYIGTYYENSPWGKIMLDWLEMLPYYNWSKSDQTIIDEFRSLMKE